MDTSRPYLWGIDSAFKSKLPLAQTACLTSFIGHLSMPTTTLDILIRILTFLTLAISLTSSLIALETKRMEYRAAKEKERHRAKRRRWPW